MGSRRHPPSRQPVRPRRNLHPAVALWLICRQLDEVRHDESGTPQLCLFLGGEGGTGKSRVITAVAELFARTEQSHRLLVTATSGTAAANINGITIHSACKFSKDTSPRASRAGDPDGFTSSGSAGLQIDGQTKMDWQEKYVLIIDEVSMLGVRTLYAVNEQLCRLRESSRDFGGIPVVIFCGDFHQFRPVQERSILLPSSIVPWEGDHGFGPEQRRQHDVAHALWGKFTTVVMLNEQVRAAQDPRLRGLLTRIRQGVQDQSDVEYRSDVIGLEAIWIGLDLSENDGTGFRFLEDLDWIGFIGMELLELQWSNLIRQELSLIWWHWSQTTIQLPAIVNIQLAQIGPLAKPWKQMRRS